MRYRFSEGTRINELREQSKKNEAGRFIDKFELLRGNIKKRAELNTEVSEQKQQKEETMVERVKRLLKENKEKQFKEVSEQKQSKEESTVEMARRLFAEVNEDKEKQFKEVEVDKKQEYINAKKAKIEERYKMARKEYLASVEELKQREQALDHETDKEQIKLIRDEIHDFSIQRVYYNLRRELELAELEYEVNKNGDRNFFEHLEELRKQFAEVKKQYHEMRIRKEYEKLVSEKQKNDILKQTEKVEPKNDFREGLKVEVNNAKQNVQSNNRGNIKKEFKEVDDGYLRLLTKQTGDTVKSEIVLGSENYIGNEYGTWLINGESKIFHLMPLYERETKNGKVVKEFEKGQFGSERTFEASYDGNNYNTVEVKKTSIFGKDDNGLDLYDDKNIIGKREATKTTVCRQDKNGAKYKKDTYTRVSKYDDSTIFEAETNWINIESKMGNQCEVSWVEKINGKPIISVLQKNGITTLTRYTPDGEELRSFRYDSEGKPMDKMKIPTRDANGKYGYIEQPYCFPGGVGNIGYENLESIDFSDPQWLGNIMTSDFVNDLNPKKDKEVNVAFLSTQYVKEHKEYLDKMEKENQVVKDDWSR